MNKLFSLSIILVFSLTGCFLSTIPEADSPRPAYVYYDNAYGTYVHLPYKIKHVSPRYIFRRYIKNYRGHYKNYTRHIRFHKPKVYVKNKGHSKRKSKSNKGKSKFKKR